MAELRAIHPEPAGELVIEALEHMLERARAGELSAVAIACVNRDGSVGSSWSVCPSTATMIGALRMLEMRLLAKVIEG